MGLIFCLVLAQDPDALRKELAVFDACELPDVRGRKFAVHDAGAGWIVDGSFVETTLVVRRPAPEGCREADFPAFCGKLRAGDALEPGLCAYWALKLGRDELARTLVELARKGAAGRKIPLDRALVDGIAGATRYQAVTDANAGRPRTELLTLWKRIASLPRNDFSAQASAMAADYESLLQEDAAWKEPADAGARAVFMLRDAAARRIGGPCHALHDAGFADPARKIYGLGWNAIPALIERLTDRRPTRAVSGLSDAAPDSFTLLTHAEAAAQLLRELTGVTLENTKGTAQTARDWWSEHRNLGDERYALRRLRVDPAFAARRLVELDAEEHLPTLVQHATVSAADRAAVLPHLAPYLGKKHRIPLEEWLNDADLRVVALSARALLEQCGTESGALRLIDRLKTAEKIDARCFDALAPVRRREAAEILAVRLDVPEARRALAEMLLLDRDADVRAWWERNGASVDWAELRRRADRKK